MARGEKPLRLMPSRYRPGRTSTALEAPDSSSGVPSTWSSWAPISRGSTPGSESTGNRRRDVTAAVTPSTVNVQVCAASVSLTVQMARVLGVVLRELAELAHRTGQVGCSLGDVVGFRLERAVARPGSRRRARRVRGLRPGGDRHRWRQQQGRGHDQQQGRGHDGAGRTAGRWAAHEDRVWHALQAGTAATVRGREQACRDGGWGWPRRSASRQPPPDGRADPSGQGIVGLIQSGRAGTSPEASMLCQASSVSRSLAGWWNS